MTTNTTNTATDLWDEIIDTLAEAGFVPLDADAEFADELGITARDRTTLGYYAGKGWDCFRLEPTDATAWATLARWDEGQLRLMAVDANGVIEAEATITLNAMGLAWLEAMIGDAR